MAASKIILKFGASVRSLRHSLGLSQEALAERADLHRTYIAGIEGGTRNVTLKSIEKLARALQVSTAALLNHANGTSGRAQQSKGELFDGKCVNILMVEDNRADAELTLRAFKEVRITNPVHIVRDGETAVDFLFGTGVFAGRQPPGQPQMVLLDLNLPKMSGLEVLRRMKAGKKTRKIPVVVLTVSQADRDIAECRRLGVEAYLVKPVDFHGLTRITPHLNLNWLLFKPAAPNGRNAWA
jgi:CheY-like chemotaxis protein/DNA-binding XRE family transcriptional regulator